ncbi:CHASE domain-containing protein [Luteibaculum oceani]|uniref:histidine kinase n=1 Tax=Luteibaculum oceani TaxID=1294296 RepID=A0A5C6UYZ1_9FLAO|nr:CHASE domain-containing protein [Luteibaculum oceani]TXC76188.1 hypothetical protein FRX97_10575 [Luteibaculum oceani]
MAIISLTIGNKKELILGPSGFLEVKLFSIDNLFNTESRQFNGEIISRSSLTYTRKEFNDSLYTVNSKFQVYLPNDTPIFSKTKEYIVNGNGRLSPSFNSGDVGYVFGPPKNLMADSFLYWHVNYNQPIWMHYVKTENVFETPAKRYEAYFKADQTKDLTGLPHVPDKYGVNLDVFLQIWVDEDSGELVKYEDFANAWYYDQKTGKRLFPWNSFHNEFQNSEVLRRIDQIQENKNISLLFQVIIPLTIFMLILIAWLLQYRKIRWFFAKYSPYIIAGLILIAGISFSVIAVNNYWKNQYASKVQNADSQGREIISSIQREMKLCGETLEFLTYQFKQADTITYGEFEQQAKRLIARSGAIFALSWIKKLSEQQKIRAEKLDTSFRVFKRNKDGSFSPNLNAAPYFPVYYIYPTEDNQKAWGYDIGSRPQTRQAILTADKTGSATLTPSLILVQEDDLTKKSVILVSPIKDNNDSLTGTVNAVVPIEKLIQSSLYRFSLPDDFKITIKDITNGITDTLTQVQRGNITGGVRFSKSIPLKGRIWNLEFIYPSSIFNSIGFIILLMGIIISVGISTLARRELSGKSKQLYSAEETIQQYNKELEVKNSELKQFIYAASHDLQEPIRTIRSFVDLIRTEENARISENARTYLKFVNAHVNKMHDLVQSLAQYIRIGNNVEFDQVDMFQIVQVTMVKLRRQIEEMAPSVILSELPVIHGFKDEMEILWLQLIRNALQYSDNKKPLVIEIGYNESPHDYRFFIRDNGIGIPPQYHTRIFEVFRRLNLNEEYDGSGIGLSICKKILHHHKGDIWVDSSENQGATFYFTIPKT